MALVQCQDVRAEDDVAPWRIIGGDLNYCVPLECSCHGKVTYEGGLISKRLQIARGPPTPANQMMASSPGCGGSIEQSTVAPLGRSDKHFPLTLGSEPQARPDLGNDLLTRSGFAGAGLDGKQLHPTMENR